MNGVSDIEVWNLIKAMPGAVLLLRSDLHAKYYRGDKECLVGSANVTNSALGWTPEPNLELLISTSFDEERINKFETALKSGCVPVDDQFYNYVLGIVHTFQEKNPKKKVEIQVEIELPQKPPTSISNESWLPSLRNPNSLFIAYRGEVEKLTRAQKEAAMVDLAFLPLPVGLSQNEFKLAVGMQLLLKPIVNKVDTFLETPRRFGAVTEYLATLSCSRNPNFEPKASWQTLMRWLIHFLPKRYSLSVPNHSEIFVKI